MISKIVSIAICLASFGNLAASSSSSTPARIANLAAISFPDGDAHGFLVNKRYACGGFRAVDVNSLNPMVAAPIYFGLAEAYSRRAESVKDQASRNEAYKLAFNWYGRIAGGDNALMWRARARMMECYLNGAGVAQNHRRAMAFADTISEQSDDLYAREIGSMRLGQMLCLGLNAPLSDANHRRGCDLLLKASSQRRNGQARELASVFLSGLNLINKKLAQGAEHLYKQVLNAPGARHEAKLLARYIELTRRSTIFRRFCRQDRSQAFADVRELSKMHGPSNVHMLAKMIMHTSFESFKDRNDEIYGQWFLNRLKRDAEAPDQLPLVRLQSFLQRAENLLAAGKTRQLLTLLQTVKQNEPEYSTFKMTICCLERFAQAGINDHQLLAEVLTTAQQILNNVGLEETIFGRLNLSFVLFDPMASAMYNDHRERAINELNTILSMDRSGELPEEQFNRSLRAIEIIRDRHPELMNVLDDSHSFESAITVLRDHYEAQM